MPAPTRPTSIPYPFASAAIAPYINTLPNNPTGSALASWKQGFPPSTMTPLSSGGAPPYGADFNGVLFATSAGVQWTQMGGQPVYDSSLVTAQGGYPLGAVLSLNDNASFVINTISGNTNDPNSGIGGATGWAPWGGLLATAGLYGAESGSGNAYVVTTTPALTTNRNGTTVMFKATHANTGGATLNAGGGVASLLRNDGSALASGDIKNNAVYAAIYDAGSGAWYLRNVVPSQVTTTRASTTYSNSGSVAVASTTGVMAGLGVTITPSSSGTILVTANTTVGNNAGSSGGTLTAQLRYGTGTPPVNGAAPSGTAIGVAVAGFVSTTTGNFNAGFNGVITGLTPGTTYWLDFDGFGTSGTNPTLSYIMISAVEK